LKIHVCPIHPEEADEKHFVHSHILMRMFNDQELVGGLVNLEELNKKGS
jgi:hypothetical protein